MQIPCKVLEKYSISKIDFHTIYVFFVVLHEVGHQQIHEEPTTNMEKLNEDSAKTQDLGTEELIQCLEIKTETNDSSEINAGGRALGKEK